MTSPHHASTWIIPARAGFTPRHARRRDESRDHPRSRGVYRSRRIARPRSGGSSPLARGLLGRYGVCRAPDQDHPRSRGVYTPPGDRGVLPSGSSPLARGLQRALVAHFRGFWIIPARAGFTRRGSGRRPTGGDHPRSRGVYGRVVEVSRQSSGSSPLARGLPGDWTVSVTGDRIIPARAGFTRPPGGIRTRS